VTTPAEDLDNLPEIIDLSREASWAMLDKDCQAYLGISAEEFARRYNAGEYDDPDDDPRIMSLAMHLEHLQRHMPIADA
jgi:hypothetical protein